MRVKTAVISGLFLITLVVGQSTAAESTYAGEVTASRLNLRAGPGEAYQTVLTAQRGTRFLVVGIHPNNPAWLQIEIPGGFDAWVYARFLAKSKDGTAKVTADRLLVRPRPTTRYHQLSGGLRRGETVKVTGEKTTSEGSWYRVQVPQRIPLYAAAKYVDNVGPASLATPKAAKMIETDDAPEKTSAPVVTPTDKRFVMLEKDIRTRMAEAKQSGDLDPLRRAVNDIDRSKLSIDNRERRVRLLADILETEHKLTVEEVKRREQEVRGDLDRKLREIELKYRKRLEEIKKEYEKSKEPRYVYTGIVRWAPDPFARTPAYRLVEGGRMRCFLIAPDFDLGKFSGKRVGVQGIADPESGTGYQTVMVKRIEILGER
jgi:hypothetical protein